MKITVFTSNQARHLHLISKLSEICDECYSVLECNTIFPGQTKDFFAKSEVMQDYFKNVQLSEKKFFGDISFSPSNNRSISLKSGDLNRVSREILEPALSSDYYVVFGSSYIKGWLIDELVRKGAINIHMGVSPYYRGSSCNFWASQDNNFHLVGSTIHKLSKGLDSGDILYHALPTVNDCQNTFDFTMKSVRAAHRSLVQRISDGSIKNITSEKQDSSLEIRYTKNKDFSDEVAKHFLDRSDTIEMVAEVLDANRRKKGFKNAFYD